MTSLRSLKTSEPQQFAEDSYTNESGRWYFNYSDRMPDIATATVALDSTSVAIVLTDLTGQVAHANRAMQDFVRSDSLASLIGKHVGDLCADMLPLEIVDDLARDGRARDFVASIQASSIAPRGSVLCTARRVDGEGHTPRWLVFSFVELDGKNASTARGIYGGVDWSDAEKLSGIGHWKIALGVAAEIEDAPVTLSSGMQALLGIPECNPTISVRDWLSAIVPDDRARFVAHLRDLMNGAHSFDCEYRLAGIGKSTCSIRSRAKLATAKHQHATDRHIVLIGTDQSVAQSDTEREHRHAIEAFTSIIDSSECPTYAVDRRMRLICANRAFRETFELHDKGVIEGCELRALFGEAPLRRSILRNIRHALSGARRIEAIELRRGEGQDAGASRWLDMSYNPIVSESGDIIGAVVFTAEISALKYTHTTDLRFAEPGHGE